MKTKLLFVCSMNRLRSPTAEVVAREMNLDADSVGTDKEATVTLGDHHLLWATRIICMEYSHTLPVKEGLDRLQLKTPVSVWFLEDTFDYLDPSLKRIVRLKLEDLKACDAPGA